MKYFDGIYRVLHVVDGDGFTAAHFISNEVVEFRLYGIDAPEIKKCKKLLRDEKETHLPGKLLMHLGNLSASFLRSILPATTYITIRQEGRKTTDMYGRALCYAFRQDGLDIGRELITQGYAKPFQEYHCEALPEYQILNTFAMQNKQGLYSLVNRF